MLVIAWNRIPFPIVSSCPELPRDCPVLSRGEKQGVSAIVSDCPRLRGTPARPGQRPQLRATGPRSNA